MKIKLENITKKYGEKTVLKKINLEIPDGSFTVILGPSGSGKTTLLRIIAGLTYPTSGEIFFEDSNVTPKPANKRNIAMVFQNYPLFPHLTVKENLMFPLESQKDGKLFKFRLYSKQQIEEKVGEVISLLHLEEHSEKYPSQLSGGEQQRVAIGRELIREPVAFLFDEPLSNIDARLRYEMRTWIRKLHLLLKKTMVYVTHDQSEAMALGDRIVLLNEGKIVQIGTPERLYENPSSKFVAKFIGGYPMNFLPFKKEGDKHFLDFDNRVSISELLVQHCIDPRISKGTIGFRAESVKEFNPNKKIEKNSLKLDCLIVDIEKILDQQILTLSFQDNQIFYITKATRKFMRKELLSILVPFNEIYFFDETGNRI
ncbi:MAG: ABC transporter ATP-binding protein [Candidatus Heimdallarchaeaceae archaeon]